jgi:hypothetical protein
VPVDLPQSEVRLFQSFEDGMAVNIGRTEFIQAV